MRKTPLFGFNLFYHDEPIIAAEDIRPGASYTGPLQSDPQNTLNYNFKRMDFVLQSILDGTLSFTSFRTAGGHTPLSPGDVGVGGDLYVQGSLILNAESPLVLVRDHRPSPHYILDFADALVHAGFDGVRSVNLSVGGAAYAASDRLNPFTPDTNGIRFQGSGVYPLVYTVSSAQPLFNTQHSAQARLLLAFDSIPQGLTRIRLEASYDGNAYTVLGQFIDGLGNKSILLPSVTFAQAPKAIRVTLEGTNSTSTDFTLTRLSLLHAGTPALENFYLPRRGGQLWGDLQLPTSKLVFGSDTNLYRSAADTLKTDDAFEAASLAGGSLSVSGSSTFAGAVTFNQNVTTASGVTIDGVDLSAFKAAYDVHEHNGTDAPKVKSANVLAQPFDSVSFPNNNNPYSYNVQSYLDALQDQINDLVTGAATFDNLLVSNLNFTVGGSFTANGVTLNAGGLSLTGNAQVVQLTSTATTGTAPLVVSSTTKVENLNADLLDGYDSADFARKAENATISGSWTFDGAVTVNNTASMQVLQTKAGTTAGGNNHLQLWNGTLRWAVGLQGDESTGNAGSDFSIWRYTDAGVFLANALNINRSTGFGTFYGDWYATDGSNGVQLRKEGGIEILKSNTPYIDFKDSSSEDYDVRLVKRNGENTLEVVGNLWLDGAHFIELRQNSSHGLRMWSHTDDGRFIMAPVDDGGYQWDREFGYSTVTNQWYCETFFTVPGLDYGAPIKFHNGSAAQEIYVLKVRASTLWSTNNANDPGDGGLFADGRLITHGRAFLNRQFGNNNPMPAISLAIGDDDSGLHWGGDGVIQMYANNSVVGGWSGTGLYLNMPLYINGQRAWQTGTVTVDAYPQSGVSGGNQSSPYGVYIKNPGQTFQLFTGLHLNSIAGEGYIEVYFRRVPFKPVSTLTNIMVTTVNNSTTATDAVFQVASSIGTTDNGDGTFDVRFWLYRQRLTASDDSAGFHILLTGLYA